MSVSKLKKSKSINKKIKLATLDIETSDGLIAERFFCGSICRKRAGRYQNFEIETTLENIGILIEKLFDWEPSITFVHNLTFESRFILQYCVQRNYSFDPIFTNSLLIALTITKNDKTLLFRDSYVLLQSSQENAEIDYSIDEQYRKIDCTDIFNKKYEFWSDDDKQLVIDHNRNDVIALLLILERFRSEFFDLCEVDPLQSYTLPSLAMRVWRTLLENDISNVFYFRNGNNSELRFKNEFDLIRNAYYGGRCEVFARPDENTICYYFDVNSLYPHVMKENRYPVGRFIRFGRTLPDSDCFGFARVTVDVDIIEHYPVLPYRTSEKLLFPTGRFTTTVSLHELRYALSLGTTRIVDVLDCIVFEQTTDLFSNYVSLFYEIKKRENGGKKRIAKLLLNSLYGKFGQKIERESTKYTQIESETEFYDSDSDFSLTTIDNKLFKIEKQKESKMYSYIMPHVASYVTAFARIHMHQLIKSVEQTGGKIYYMDTDSLVVDSIGKSVLENYVGNEIGQLKLEAVGQFWAFAPKVYLFKQEDEKFSTKIKGISQNFASELDSLSFISAIEKLAKLLRDGVEYSRYCSLRESLNVKKQTVTSKNEIKKLSLDDTKRTWISEFESTPIYLDERYRMDSYYVEKKRKQRIREYKTPERKYLEIYDTLQREFDYAIDDFDFDRTLTVEEHIKEFRKRPAYFL